MINLFKRGKNKSKYLEIIPKEKFPFFYEKPFYVRQLEKKFPDCFYVEDNDLKFRTPMFSGLLSTEEEIFILSEILVDNCYDFETKDEVVVLDIGMNVGFASLFFASKKNVKRVIGYDPFKPTYDQAIKNFEINPNLLDKIEPKNIGLSSKSEYLSLAYSYKHKGNVGADGITEHLNPADLNQETVNTRDIVEELKEVLQNENSKIFVKIDCEGCEYELVNRLIESKAITKINYLFLEYHKGNCDKLVDDLTSQGFFLIRKEINEKYGMIYATKC